MMQKDMNNNESCHKTSINWSNVIYGQTSAKPYKISNYSK